MKARRTGGYIRRVVPSFLAEGVGFEPTVTCATTVFKTAPLNRSGTPPSAFSRIRSRLSVVAVRCRQNDCNVFETLAPEAVHEDAIPAAEGR